ncbi:predicted protein [Naegleria gruberi]|uniref:Predicted protein n=1 Tax=Naegleria gruberi TaxID=5762 RepID=D2V7I9_NAEGR|nr:uncharacterized protein NAEGRDRAFT_64820 [Naegleria gruberi]EFC47387.1 predicted protein [Naegleria gruberi]|eukprot:XP_002680131.1 predicted protein [Naegleria gruberi strain NEG-M]
MGGLGRNKRMLPRRYRLPKYFQDRKEFFLIESPYLSYEKSDTNEYATVTNTEGDYPPLMTPITKSEHTIALQKKLKKKVKKKVDQTPTFEKILDRTVEVSAPDIIPSLKEELNHNIVKLKINNVALRKHAETEFNGFRLSQDKLASLIGKGRSTITLNQEFKSLDGYKIRIAMIVSTRMTELQLKKTSYASKSQIHKIRTVMAQVLTKHISKMNILEFVEQMAIKCGMGAEIRTKCENIYPLEDHIQITKIKVVEKPPRHE